jgi:hypothetical protein
VEHTVLGETPWHSKPLKCAHRALWCGIAKAWLAYHEDYLGNEALPNEEERKLLGALVAISTGVEDVSKLNVPVEVGRGLVQCYDDPAGNQ